MGPMRQPNTWSRTMDTRPSVKSAAAMGVFYMFGACLSIASVWVILGSLLWATGAAGSGWQGHLGGSVGLVVGLAMLWLSRRLCDAYRVEPKP